MSLPWWASSTTFAPWSDSSRMVGTQALIRAVDFRVPAARSTGWFISTRHNTVFPPTENSSSEWIPKRMWMLLSRIRRWRSSWTVRSSDTGWWRQCPLPGSAASASRRGWHPWSREWSRSPEEHWSHTWYHFRTPQWNPPTGRFHTCHPGGCPDPGHTWRRKHYPGSLRPW